MNVYIVRIIILILTPVFLLALATNGLSHELRISPSQKDLENNPDCGSCIDVYIAKDSAIAKRGKNQSFGSFHNVVNTNLLVPKFKKDHHLQSPLINETVPRISLAILAHRKVVMLN